MDKGEKMIKYFIVAVGGGNLPLPIMCGDDEWVEEIALYDSKKEAIEMAENQPLCAARGYEVFPWVHL